MPKKYTLTPFFRPQRGWGTEVSEHTKKIIWERDQGICVYCGRNGAEIDHVVPRREGGPSTRANLVLACRSCNRHKWSTLDTKMITMAFFWLLEHGEKLDWLEDSLEYLKTQEFPAS